MRPLCFLFCLLHIALSSSKPTAHPGNSVAAYSDSSPAVSQKYKNAYLRQLKFSFDPHSPTTVEQQRQIKDVFQRARMSHPDAQRQVQVKGKGKAGTVVWKEQKQSNADFLHARRERSCKSSKMRWQRENERRKEFQERTGVLPPSKQTLLRQQRMQRAEQAPKKQIVQLCATGHRVPTPDPKGRTNEDYLQEYARRNRVKSRTYYWAKGKAKLEARKRESQLKTSSTDGPSSKPTTAASPTNMHQAEAHSAPQSPSSSGTIDWAEFSDLE